MPERGPVGMGIGGGSVRVGVRNRLGEAIGKPVANLHGRWTSAATVPREKGKKGTPVFSKSIPLLCRPIRFSPFGSRREYREHGEWRRNERS